MLVAWNTDGRRWRRLVLLDRNRQERVEGWLVLSDGLMKDMANFCQYPVGVAPVVAAAPGKDGVGEISIVVRVYGRTSFAAFGNNRVALLLSTTKQASTPNL